MQADSIYEETVPFPLVKVVLAILTVFTLLMLFLLVYQLIIDPLGSKPAPNWFYLVMFLFLAGITVFVADFNKLSIKTTAKAITVSFGIMKKTIPFKMYTRFLKQRNHIAPLSVSITQIEF